MKGFTFSQEYYDTLKKIKRKQDRAAMLTAIVEFIFEDKEPMGISEVAALAFEIHRNALEKSKTMSRNGQSNPNQKIIKSKSNQNQTENKNEENTNLISVCSSFDFSREKEFPTKELPNKEKVTQKENNPLEKYTQEKENYIPPFYSPQGEEKNKYADEFFGLYPRYAKDRAKMRVDVDYKRLIEEFGQSQYLRSLYTVKQINDIYALIISGDFRDKEKQDPYAGVNARAARERWYSERRAKAEGEASKILNRFMQDEEFKRIHKRLNALIPEIAKAEYQSESGDDKAKKQLVKLTQEQEKLRMQYRGIIERNGKTEEDLRPKWHCKHCSDTGFLSDGRMCDCYCCEGGKT